MIQVPVVNQILSGYVGWYMQIYLYRYIDLYRISTVVDILNCIVLTPFPVATTKIRVSNQPKPAFKPLSL